MSLFGDENYEFNEAEDCLRRGIERLVKEGRKEDAIRLAASTLEWALRALL